MDKPQPINKIDQQNKKEVAETLIEIEIYNTKHSGPSL